MSACILMVIKTQDECAIQGTEVWAANDAFVSDILPKGSEIVSPTSLETVDTPLTWQFLLSTHERSLDRPIAAKENFYAVKGGHSQTYRALDTRYLTVMNCTERLLDQMFSLYAANCGVQS